MPTPKFLEMPSASGHQQRSQFAGSFFGQHEGDEDSNSGNGPDENEESKQ
jgi:hypothetical protein